MQTPQCCAGDEALLRIEDGRLLLAPGCLLPAALLQRSAMLQDLLHTQGDSQQQLPLSAAAFQRWCSTASPDDLELLGELGQSWESILSTLQVSHPAGRCHAVPYSGSA